MTNSVSPRVALAAEVYELISHVNHLVGPRGDARVVTVKAYPPHHLAVAFELAPPAGRQDWNAFVFPHEGENPQSVWGEEVPGFGPIRDAARRCVDRSGALDSPADAAVAKQLLGVFLASPLWAGGEAESWTSFEPEDGVHLTWAVAHLRIPCTSALELLADKLLTSERAVAFVPPPTGRASGRPPGQWYDTDLLRLRDVEELEWKEIRRRLGTLHGRNLPQLGSLRKRYAALKNQQSRSCEVKKG